MMESLEVIDKEYAEFIEKYKKEKKEWRTSLPKPSPVFKFELLEMMKFMTITDSSSLSLPIFINEPISLNQLLFEGHQFYRILDECADAKSSVEKIVKIAAFQTSLCCLANDRFRNCFNPLLGETFEYFDPETGLCGIIEKVSQHPPTTALHFQTRKWIRQASIVSTIELSPTKVDLNFKGNTFTEFKGSKEKFASSPFNFTVHEPTSSSAWLEYVGSLEIKSNSSKANVKINFIPMKKSTDVRGFEGIVYDENGENAGVMNGDYTESIYFTPKDGEKTLILDIKSKLETFPEYYHLSKFGLQMNDPNYDVTCPTDSRFRPDMRNLENGEMGKADEEKQRLEKKQQTAQEKRQSEKSEWIPKWFTLPTEVGFLDEKIYAYKGKYWSSKLNNDFNGSPDIF